MTKGINLKDYSQYENNLIVVFRIISIIFISSMTGIYYYGSLKPRKQIIIAIPTFILAIILSWYRYKLTNLMKKKHNYEFWKNEKAYALYFWAIIVGQTVNIISLICIEIFIWG
jgi:hypothetical protein